MGTYTRTCTHIKHPYVNASIRAWEGEGLRVRWPSGWAKGQMTRRAIAAVMMAKGQVDIRAGDGVVKGQLTLRARWAKGQMTLRARVVRRIAKGHVTLRAGYGVAKGQVTLRAR